MTVNIDKAGRVTIPKPVRDQYGLKPGDAVELVEASDGILIRSVSQSKTSPGSGPRASKPLEESAADQMRKAWGL